MTPLEPRRVVVLGDAMLDRFLYGAAERLSPEAPVPVVRLARRDSMAGGAGNVARNIAALGGEPVLLALAGADAEGAELAALLGPGARLVQAPGRRTTVKLRVIAARQQVVRVDEEEARPATAEEEAALLTALDAALGGAGALVLSDYGKGVLTPALCRAAIAAARRAGVPCLVDPKGSDLARFRGADLLILEGGELPGAGPDEGSVAEAARLLMESLALGAVLVSRGAEGLTLVRPDGALHFRAEASEVHDPAGGGDAVVAVVAAALAAGLSLDAAARLAALALGIVSRKSGIALVRGDELLEGLTPGRGAMRKLVSLPLAVEVAERWRHRGWRIGFLRAHGLCPEALTEQARRWCDRLMVGVATEGEAAILLAERPEVDLIAVGEGWDEDAMRLLRPDLVVAEAADEALARLLGEWGGEVRTGP